MNIVKVFGLSLMTLVAFHPLCYAEDEVEDPTELDKLIVKLEEREGCQPYADFLAKYEEGPIGPCITSSRADEELWKLMDELYMGELGTSVETCAVARSETNGLKLCTDLNDFSIECSCPNIQCLGAEVVDGLAAIGSEAVQQSCKDLTDGACAAFRTDMNNRCTSMAQEVVDHAEISDGSVVLYESCDACTSGALPTAMFSSSLALSLAVSLAVLASSLSLFSL